MKKEDFMKLGLDEETSKKCETASLEELKSYIPKTRFDEINDQKKKLELDVKERDKQLDDLKKSAGDNEELKKQIETLQKDNKEKDDKYDADMKKLKFELIIQNDSDIYLPLVEDSIVWKTERKGVPGQLDFKVLDDGNLKIEEGNAVSFKVDGEKVFYGFIFTLKRDKEKIINVTCYDQLRYFKNKDTYVYTNKTAGELIKMISEDFEMQCGEIEDTGFKIPSRIEENTTLFDMIQNALDLTLENKKEMYVLYDDFGKIALKNISSMVVEILIDFDTGENFDYSSSIDSETYNKIKLTYDNKDTGKRDVYISQDGNNINKWGVLQYFDTISEGENGKAKADALLSLYNQKARTLSVKNAFGDIRVRGGSMVVVQLDLGDTKINNLMIVEKCKHDFKNYEHFMDLTLRGGEFIA